MNTRLCPNGHVMDSSWDRCPYCPPPLAAPGLPSGAPPRRPVPPTRIDVGGAAPPPVAPLPVPVPAPVPPPPYRRPDAAARKTRVHAAEMEQEKAVPFLGWLVIFSGNHRFEDFRIREGRNSIGSDPSNQIVLTDDHISSRHATINAMLKDGERVYVLRDLDSRNGTFLNEGEEPVYHEELVDNDTVVFGTVKCKFKCL